MTDQKAFRGSQGIERLVAQQAGLVAEGFQRVRLKKIQRAAVEEPVRN